MVWYHGKEYAWCGTMVRSMHGMVQWYIKLCYGVSALTAPPVTAAPEEVTTTPLTTLTPPAKTVTPDVTVTPPKLTDRPDVVIINPPWVGDRVRER